MQNLLYQLGVRDDSLSVEEKAFLDQNGYLNLGQLLSPEEIEIITQRISFLLAQEGEAAGSELAASANIRYPKELGSDRLADLVNKGQAFDVFYTHPKVLAGTAHVVGQELKLSSLNYRAAKPGKGLQGLHVDWHEAVEPGDYKVCNSIWLLDDFYKANGATRLVPGTHLKAQLPQNVMTNPLEPHPDEIVIEAPAGSVFIFNSHVWHGGTTNTTGNPRKAIHSYFCRADQGQQTDQKRYILAETLERIPQAAREVLAV